MRPVERRDSGQHDLRRARLDQIVDLADPQAKLASGIDCGFLEERLGAVYTDKPGRRSLPTRLMAGLAILKHMYGLSDEDLCACWLENPYYQLLCGEESSATNCRSIVVRSRAGASAWGGDKLPALLQERLHAATRIGAAYRPAVPGRGRCICPPCWDRGPSGARSRSRTGLGGEGPGSS